MRILVVKTHAFGDALLATPAVYGLVSAGHSVTVLTGPSSRPVWERVPGLQGLVHSPAPCSAARLLRWTLRNRQKGFDRVIHLGSSRKAARWLRFLAGMKVISGSNSETGFGVTKPAAADYCRIAGVECLDTKPLFPVSDTEKKTAAELTGEIPYAVLAPGGARNPSDFVPQKRWIMSRWGEVSDFLCRKGLRVFLVGGEQDREEIASVPGENLAGKLTWGETAAVIERASVFAGNDSGPAHLAVAEDTSAIVLFGPTDPEALYDTGAIAAICGNVPCSPCYANSIFPGCTGEENCMASIDTERVKKALEEILQK